MKISLSRFAALTAAGGMLFVSGVVGAAWVDEYKSGIVWPEPPIVAPGETVGAPPADALVLFGGTDLSQWNGGDDWKIENGYAQVQKSSISTKESFGDCQLHLEFATPEVVKGSGQGRGNSGVYLMGKYEVQILDSYDNTTYFDGQCASIYKQTPPIVNVCRKPGEWQTYDIIFTAPRFGDDGELTSPAAVTVLQNGVLVQNHFVLHGGTSYTEAPRYQKHAEKLPLSLQNHGNPTRFRNIWIRENVHAPVGEPPQAAAQD
ncbi:3-keto-disaccharide hydrolase [Lignipirellula cremea]|uniref:3-keto-alpha-glucoside-1,2-lyase/3-keto-2-hydroxy-glucal hydratase domain-containing protein n=1 Tax=Lignipirellula cremea TaxID=2528010 RepID=A0A518DLP9_9BACT|nr:DUF1080 domain-containing protein [Lignipirellula cremea]QDU92755.1 hypothetical protein Pla8534_05040 [Lignipirellula cremea]